MLKVYKYSVPAADCFELDLPTGAQILTVKTQYGKSQLWALVDPEAKTQKRIFRLAGTGHAVTEPSEKLAYIDTILLFDDSLVLHLFEVLR